MLTFKTPADVRSARVVKYEKASAHRWYLDLRLEHPDEVDPELMRWFRASYQVWA